jgi:hypothetical protein
MFKYVWEVQLALPRRKIFFVGTEEDVSKSFFSGNDCLKVVSIEKLGDVWVLNENDDEVVTNEVVTDDEEFNYPNMCCGNGNV